MNRFSSAAAPRAIPARVIGGVLISVVLLILLIRLLNPPPQPTYQPPPPATPTAGATAVPLGDDFGAEVGDVPDDAPPPSGPALPSVRYAADTFSRTLMNRWGAAEAGGTYTLSGYGRDFAVNGAAGLMTVPSRATYRAARLSRVAALDVDLTFRVMSDREATGRGQRVGFLARRTRTGTEYRAHLRFTPEGQVGLQAFQTDFYRETAISAEVIIPGLSHVPGTSYWVRAQVLGTNPTTIRMKAWPASQPEPAEWQYSATNADPLLQGPGAVGLRAALSGSTTNAPVLFTFDDFTLRSLDPAPAPAPGAPAEGPTPPPPTGAAPLLPASPTPTTRPAGGTLPEGGASR